MGTTPQLGLRFPGLDLNTTMVNPPDTMGAIGPRHFVEIVNGRVAIFDKRTGLRRSHVSINSFFAVVPGAKFDPRVLFDAPSGRWIASAARAAPVGEAWGIVLGVSRTDDPLGEWFQVFFHGAEREHILHDFPMLGVGPQSITIAACVCGIGGARSLWAFEKSALMENPPRLGVVTQWDFPSDEIIPLPVQSLGAVGADVVLGVGAAGGSLSVFFVDGPMTSPTLRYQGRTQAPYASYSVGLIPAPGLEPRLGVSAGMFVSSAAIYRNRTVWMVLRGELDGRAAFHWLRVNPFTIPPRVIQNGIVAHPSLHLFFPSLAVNAVNDVVFGFAGADEETYLAGYFAGHRRDDSHAAAGPVELLKAGEAVYGTSPDVGRRWGDYTATSVDPDDDLTFWTIQQYAGARGEPNTWGTWVGKLSFQGFDCNENGIEDACDLNCGSPGCRVPCGGSDDCQGNGVPDECEPADDCDANGVPDVCELSLGTTADCNENLLPDACEDGPDCDGNGVPDECDPDCNDNDVPDVCDMRDGTSGDCNRNGVPDDCEPFPSSLLGTDPPGGASLWRSKRNIIRLQFVCDLPAEPVPGEDILVTEMLDGGFFGPDFSSRLRFSVENGNVLRIQDPGASFEHGKWYAVVNGGWSRIEYFAVHFPVLVGDVDADGRVSDADLPPLRSAVPTYRTGDADRRDLNGDRAILFSDLSTALSRIPSGHIPRPPGH